MDSMPTQGSTFQPRGPGSPNTHYVTKGRRRMILKLADEQAREDRQGLGHQRIHASKGGGNGLTPMEREVYWARYSAAWKSLEKPSSEYTTWLNR